MSRVSELIEHYPENHSVDKVSTVVYQSINFTLIIKKLGHGKTFILTG